MATKKRAESKPKARRSMDKFKSGPAKKSPDKPATARKGYRERLDRSEL